MLNKNQEAIHILIKKRKESAIKSRLNDFISDFFLTSGWKY